MRPFFLEVVMYRKNVSKHKSAKSFRSRSRRTKFANIRPSPMRGGIRL